MKLMDNQTSNNSLTKKHRGFQVEENPRNKLIKVYLTKNEKEAVERLVATTRYSSSEYCRRRALLEFVISDVDGQLINQLSTLAGELRRQGGLQKNLFLTTESGKAHKKELAQNLIKINTILEELLQLVLIIKAQKESKVSVDINPTISKNKR